MKMIRAVIRPEKEEEVVKNLEAEGFPAMTKMGVLGRGKQKGIQVGSALYDEIAKTLVLIVVDDAQVEKATQAISKAAHTGNFGDGKIFVTPVETTHTIRTGKEGI